MREFKIHYWPVFASGWLMLTFIISYSFSISNGHVYPLFPYISDTGTLPPESCVFGQMFNLGALFMFITLYIRYRFITIKVEQINQPLWRWNGISFSVGILACLGVSIVGNFQETSNLPGHLVGAMCAFLGGFFHFALQAYITWRIHPSMWIRFVRITLSVLFLPFFFAGAVASAKSLGEFKLTHPEHVQILWWTPKHPAYGMHLVATFTEWLMVFTLIFSMLTYVVEFRELEYGGVLVQAKENAAS